MLHGTCCHNKSAARLHRSEETLVPCLEQIPWSALLHVAVWLPNYTHKVDQLKSCCVGLLHARLSSASTLLYVYMYAGSNIVVEEFLDGEEASFFALLDGHTCLALASAQVCMSHQQSCIFPVCHALEIADMISRFALV